MSKSPFEIRQGLLHLAYDLLKEQKHSKFRVKDENNRLKQMKISQGGKAEDVEQFLESDLVIKEEELFGLAEKLKAFVSKKD
jgi:hypothetical protein